MVEFCWLYGFENLLEFGCADLGLPEVTFAVYTELIFIHTACTDISRHIDTIGWRLAVYAVGSLGARSSF
jgi:hypothetical protein